MTKIKVLVRVMLICAMTLLCLGRVSYSMDVTLAWDANQESDLKGYKLYYDTNSGHPYSGAGAQEGNSPIEILLGEDEDPDPGLVQYTVHNLPDGTYYFAVTAYNTGELESGYSNEVNATYIADITPPLISSLEVTSVNNTTAVVEWTTDEASDSQVRYGTSSGSWSSYTYSVIDDALVTMHIVTLTGLLEGTAYFFCVGSMDALGNGPSISNELTFTTQTGTVIENLSSGKPVTGSRSDWGTSISSMVDGLSNDPDARWAAYGVPNWVEVDLENDYMISMINVCPYLKVDNLWYYDEAWNVKYKGSADGEWKDFTSVVKLSGAGTLIGPGISVTGGDPSHHNSDDDYKYYSFSFTPVVAKYIRFEVTQGDSDGDSTGTEIEIYGVSVPSNSIPIPKGFRIGGR